MEPHPQQLTQICTKRQNSEKKINDPNSFHTFDELCLNWSDEENGLYHPEMDFSTNHKL